MRLRCGKSIRLHAYGDCVENTGKQTGVKVAVFMNVSTQVEVHARVHERGLSCGTLQNLQVK